MNIYIYIYIQNTYFNSYMWSFRAFFLVISVKRSASDVAYRTCLREVKDPRKWETLIATTYKMLSATQCPSHVNLTPAAHAQSSEECHVIILEKMPSGLLSHLFQLV